MSRGFVKEGDQEEHIFIPPRAALPQGVINYVTPEGMEELLKEKELLEEEFKAVPKDNQPENRRTVSLINGKLNLLNERIVSARVIDPADQPQDEVRFGALVEFLSDKRKIKFQIVGVDEADIKKLKVSFLAPIAVALIGSKVGEEVKFQHDHLVQDLRVLKIYY